MSRKPKARHAANTQSLALCTCANIRKAARVVTQMFDAALQPAGLKATQFNLLAVLAKRGDLALTLLADALVMDRTTLTRNLKPLVAQGLISIETEKDQRVRRIVLTKKGAGKFQKTYPLWAEVQSRIVTGLGSERWAGLVADLNAAVDVAQGR